ncbi:hypothetical protein [Paenibacillus sp. YYML68]|uniref:hypothetical protein n=1 Tax=Paenibacillus sp. YYML68 TaxID=2909250 RepID=UPI002490E0F2|nr:hypothetical protein [Paenibacillus sp. YYML68]
MSKTERSIMSKLGYYTKLGNDFFGVYLSEDGPRLFMNDQVYDLTSSDWDIEMIHGRC